MLLQLPLIKRRSDYDIKPIKLPCWLCSLPGVSLCSKFYVAKAHPIPIGHFVFASHNLIPCLSFKHYNVHDQQLKQGNLVHGITVL
jgi:hypothetical protein